MFFVHCIVLRYIYRYCIELPIHIVINVSWHNIKSYSINIHLVHKSCI